MPDTPRKSIATIYSLPLIIWYPGDVAPIPFQRNYKTRGLLTELLLLSLDSHSLRKHFQFIFYC